MGLCVPSSAGGVVPHTSRLGSVPLLWAWVLWIVWNGCRLALSGSPCLAGHASLLVLLNFAVGPHLSQRSHLQLCRTKSPPNWILNPTPAVSPPRCQRRVTSLPELQGGDGAWGLSPADQTTAPGLVQWGREGGLAGGEMEAWAPPQLSPQLPGDFCMFIFALGSEFLASEMGRDGQHTLQSDVCELAWCEPGAHQDGWTHPDRPPAPPAMPPSTGLCSSRPVGLGGKQKPVSTPGLRDRTEARDSQPSEAVGKQRGCCLFPTAEAVRLVRYGGQAWRGRCWHRPRKNMEKRESQGPWMACRLP